MIRLNNSFHRLVGSLRKARLRVLGGGRIDSSSHDGRSPSLDLRAARPGGRPEFEQMAQRLGVDVARIPPHLRGTVRDAERVCLDCHDVRRCRRWLAQETVDDPQLFCSNAPLLRAIATKKAARHSS